MNTEISQESDILQKLLKGQTMSLILMKCQDILRDVTSMSTYELQLALSQYNQAGSGKAYGLNYYVTLFSTPQFVDILRNNERLNFDRKTRTWSFVSPYSNINGIKDVEKFVDSNLTGVEVNNELLASNPKMLDWINSAIEQKLIRAVRTGKTARCKGSKKDINVICDLTSTRLNKCDNCLNLRSVKLYSKKIQCGPVNNEVNLDVETLVDEDVKKAWIDIKPHDVIKLIENFKDKTVIKSDEEKKKVRKRATHANHNIKLANTHIFNINEIDQ